jgi:hypothetical protein
MGSPDELLPAELASQIRPHWRRSVLPPGRGSVLSPSAGGQVACGQAPGVSCCRWLSGRRACLSGVAALRRLGPLL